MIRTTSTFGPSEDLFDFDNNYKRMDILTKIEGFLIKEKFSNVKFVKLSEQREIDDKMLRIDIKVDKFYLNFLHKDLDFNKLKLIPWIVIRNNKSINGEREYKLTIGDIIKLGRIKLIIRKIYFEDCLLKQKFIFENERNDILMTKSEKFNIQENITKNNTNTRISHIRIPSKMTMNTSRNNINNLSFRNDLHTLTEKITIDDTDRNYKKRICRICLEDYGPNDQSSQNNVLINPCKCSGSSKYIHLFCLQTWLKSKAVVNSQLSTSCNYYEIKGIECEICKSYFPGKFFPKIKTRSRSGINILIFMTF